MLHRYTGERKALRFAVYDLEWIPHTYEERLVGCYDAEGGYRSYKNTVEFLSAELNSHNRGMIFYAHAGGLADVQFVLRAVIERGNPNFRVKGHWSGSSLVICSIKAGKNSWTFVDSFWLLRDSLAKIGKSLGLDKGGSDYRCSDFPACGHPVEGGKKLTCIFYAPIAILRDYNALDCRILYAAIERLEDEVLALGGFLRMTIASTAMMLFRAAFLSKDVETCPAVNATCRDAYVASRVEVIGRECQVAQYYDINSSFPWSMTKPQPGKYIGKDLCYREGDRMCVADATVHVPDYLYIPPVPMRALGRVYFPTGTFRRWFAGEDLALLLETGGSITEVHEVMHFDPFSDLAAYVSVLYELRRRSTDDFQRLVLKYMLNSLYGKFGEGYDKAALLVNPKRRPRCAKLDRCKGPLGCRCVEMYLPGVYKVIREVSVEHSHVPVAMNITASSRALITKMLLSAYHEGGRSYYCDTDSIVTTASFEPSDALGLLKKEYDLSAGQFLSPKLYRISGREPGKEASETKTIIRAKGFRALSESEFEALARGDKVAIKRMVRIRENFAKGCVDPHDGDYLKRTLGHLPADRLLELGLSARFALRPKRAMLPSGDSRPWDMDELKP